MVTHEWYTSFEFHDASQVAAFHISKPYDNVFHTALFSYDLPLTLSSCIKNFFFLDRVTVAVDGHNSNIHSVNADVP